MQINPIQAEASYSHNERDTGGSIQFPDKKVLDY